MLNIAKFLRLRIFKNMYERLFLYFRILKNNYFLKNEKSRKSRKNYSEFSTLPYSQSRIWNSWKKISEISGGSEFSTWLLKALRQPTVSFIIFWDFSMFYQIFPSSQLKRWAIITYKHGIYELPHELPNDLRLRKLGNIRKVSKLHRMIA